MLTKPTPDFSVEIRVLNAIRPHIQPWIADGIGSQFAHGATVKDVHRQLTDAIGQINRINRYCAERVNAVLANKEAVSHG